MRKLKEEKTTIKLAIEEPEDLWFLSHLIDEHDSVTSSTERKVKIGTEENAKVVRKKMTLTIATEKVDYAQGTLRVLGTIIAGPDDVPRGEHHSLSLQPGDELTITKNSWAGWQREKLDESCQGSKERILVVLFDREEALFALLTTQGHRILSTLKGTVQKKGVDEAIKSTYWKELAQTLIEYDTRYKTNSIIAASPAFWKDYVKDLLGNLSSKTVYATVSQVDETALSEVVRRPELKAALAKDRSAKEALIMEELLKALSQDRCAYGIDEVEGKAREGSLSTLAVSENLLQESRQEGTYERLDTIMKEAEQTKAQVILISTEDPLKQLDGLGGIAGSVRW